VKDEERYTLSEAAALTGLTTQALARRIERGSLPATKVDGRRFVRLEDLAAAGLLDPATQGRPRWADGVDAGVLAREIVTELTLRGLRIRELERRIEQLGEMTDRQQKELDQGKRERAELRRQIERLQQRSS
jgi:excisionase family DNA binding protein